MADVGLDSYLTNFSMQSSNSLRLRLVRKSLRDSLLLLSEVDVLSSVISSMLKQCGDASHTPSMARELRFNLKSSTVCSSFAASFLASRVN